MAIPSLNAPIDERSPAENAEATYSAVEHKQAAHYDELAEYYESHYGDKHSTTYRRQFLYYPLLGPLNLQGKLVLEGMSGSGQATAFLLEKGATVVGLDISPKLIATFEERWPSCTAVQGSMGATPFPANHFDCVVIIGGLHHLYPDLDRSIVEIHRILKPGGHFYFMEPHAGSLPDTFRKLWYRCDSLFESNEQAVNVDQLQKNYWSQFEFAATRYVGTIGYLFVLQSMVFRIPKWLKALYSPLLIKLESILAPLCGKRLSCAATCLWVKR